MIGIIIKVLADMIVELSDPKTLTHIYTKAGIDPKKVFRINEPYDDDEWQRLMNATLQVMNLKKEIAYQAYANAFINYAEKMFPTWFSMARNSREFLLLQPIIHNSFASSIVNNQEKQKVKDKFLLIQDEKSNDLTVFYQSPNKLCDLYIALAHRLAQRYGDTLDITTKQCILKGDVECEMHIHFTHIAKANHE